MVNRHIEEYLDYYCDFGKNLPFAILLKGKWGCGKTYFIKKYINKRKDKNILHISLYGIDSFSGIKEKIIIELLPFIPEKYSRFAGSIFKNIKKVPKIKDWIPEDIDELLADIFLKKNNKCIFVFDDLERCNIKIDKLLGFINNLVEFKNQKVIIISDEEKILKSADADKYREIKEKLIGKEFCIESSLEEAINLFVGRLKDGILVKESAIIKKLLSRIYIQSTYDNLRLLQQGLSQFEYFFGTFKSKAREDSELLERMFYEFIVIFVEYKRGNIKGEQFFGKYPHFFKGVHEDREQKHFLDKYNYSISSWLSCFNVSILGKILQGINLSDDEKTKMVNDLEGLADINKESWQIVWYRYDHSDKDFFDSLNDVKEKWNKKEYEDFYVVLHIFGIFLGLSEDGIWSKSKEGIFNEGKEYIEFLIKENKFPLNLSEHNAGFSWRENAYGLQYCGMNTDEWKKMIKFIEEKINELKPTYIKNKIKNELMPVFRGEKSAGDLVLFVNYNFHHYSGNKEAYFQYLDTDEMVKILIENNRMTLYAMQKVFKDRYERAVNEINGIEQEIPFLKELKSKLEQEIAEIEKSFGNKKTPKSFLLQSFVDNAIKPFIKDEVSKTV